MPYLNLRERDTYLRTFEFNSTPFLECRSLFAIFDIASAIFAPRNVYNTIESVTIEHLIRLRFYYHVHVVKLEYLKRATFVSHSLRLFVSFVILRHRFVQRDKKISGGPR